MSAEFPTRYDPTEEAARYQRWEQSGAFAPAATSRTGASFAMVLPPPNVTGTLHVGHAVMLAIEDMIIRYHRMQGDRTLWIPGLDHAAIATQNVVEKKLKKENVQGHRTRHELGREAFLAEVGVFVEQSKARIIEQTKAMGASLDWSRLAYTLDEQRSRAVREMFVRMHAAGILYRRDRIVNWCPRCKSTLADDEVQYKEERTTLYTFRYDEQWPEDLAVATTRPETKFGDTAVAVHPDDPRAAKYAGTTMRAKFATGAPELEIRVIADAVVDRAFGTGALGVTPAHSVIDADMAVRHQLPMRQVIDEDGELEQLLGVEYGCLSIRDARAKLVEELRGRGLIQKEEPITHNLSVCYRCETPVEPLPKLQWFVDVNKQFRNGKSLKDLALAAVRDQEIQILPERFTKEYFHWMEHLRDWCISRQIWFGHQIPVWYHDTCLACNENGKSLFDVPAVIGELSKDAHGLIWCVNCKNGYDSEAHFSQDPETLDTWFSSGMWTFSTLGWPDAAVTHPDGRIEKSGDLAAFHPTAVLETGYDILFFWVARMILMTEFALGEVPFRTVYLHGLVRDAQGRKMSKSLGNVIDPLDMVGKYGADAVRLALFIGTAPGMDTKLDEQKIAGYAKFTTKIWNIARYVSMLIGDAKVTGQISDIPESQLTAADRWVLARCWATIAEVSAAYQSFECARGAQAAYDFAWHEFADWYIEATKIDRRPHHPILLLAFLETILKLLHPAMPFVTEALWERTRSHRNGDESTLITSPWPTTSELPEVADAGAFAFAQEVATAIRQVRNEDQIPPKILLEVTLIPRVSQEQEWCNDAEVIALLRGFVRAAWVRCANADGAPRIVVRSTDVYVRAADEAAS